MSRGTGSWRRRESSDRFVGSRLRDTLRGHSTISHFPPSGWEIVNTTTFSTRNLQGSRGKWMALWQIARRRTSVQESAAQ